MVTGLIVAGAVLAIAIVIGAAGLVRWHWPLHKVGLYFGPLPGRDECQACGGEGFVVVVDGVTMPISHQDIRRRPHHGSPPAGRQHRRELRRHGHEHATDTRECRPCGGFGSIPRAAR